MKMDLIEGSETSAIINQTPGNYPKENLLYPLRLLKIEQRENANASGQIFVINIDFLSPPFGIWSCYRERIEPLNCILYFFF